MYEKYLQTDLDDLEQQLEINLKYTKMLYHYLEGCKKQVSERGMKNIKDNLHNINLVYDLIDRSNKDNDWKITQIKNSKDSNAKTKLQTLTSPV